ncbi:hypothetical protein [Vibrio genomosp. F10]|uniref:hypothetical protein n=1 Tax=Vibrio genomosp. F10 TaxID=723171 RepID=UPI0002FBA015|nr:hypothetical protein [Vibrio genomosp. F10]OEF09554.1 hypothetical protein A1QI_13975 [Vibrio genomosp. F10 str. 9ZB36]
MAVKDLTEQFNKLSRTFMKKKGMVGVEELHCEKSAIRISESKLKHVLHAAARSEAGFKIYYSQYKKGNGYNVFINKSFANYAYQRISKLNIYKKKLKRIKNNG